MQSLFFRASSSTSTTAENINIGAGERQFGNGALKRKNIDDDEKGAKDDFVEIASKHLASERDAAIDCYETRLHGEKTVYDEKTVNGDIDDSRMKTAKTTQEKKTNGDLFMKTFDSDADCDEAMAFLTRFGFVCLRNVVSAEKRTQLRARVDRWLDSLQCGLKVGDWTTFVNSNMPDNFSSGALDGVAPPTQSVLEQMQSDRASERVGEHFGYAASLRCGATPAQTVPHRETGNDVQVVVDGDPLATRKCRVELPVYTVASEMPSTALRARSRQNAFSASFSSSSSTTAAVAAAAENDEFASETAMISDLRYRFDTLTHSQEAWDVRSDPRIYRFFRTLLHAGDDLLVSIDRFLYQRPLLSRPKNLTEDWKNNFEQRPLWEQNPFWRGDPVLTRCSPAQTGRKSIKGGKREENERAKRADGTTFMTQCFRRPRKRRRIAQKTNVLKDNRSNLLSAIRGEQHIEQKGSTSLEIEGSGGGGGGGEGEAAESDSNSAIPLTPLFTGYQAFLALDDMTIGGGAFFLVPGFHTIYQDFAMAHAEEWSGIVENVVRARADDPLVQQLVFPNAVSIPLRAGTMLVFDKRIPRWGSPNRRARSTACGMYISMWPRDPVFDAAYRRVRALSVRFGVRCTAMRHLTGHSTSAPRWKRAVPAAVYQNYVMPRFTELGLCLLGVRRYNAEILHDVISK